jgi:hypothetical protein
VLHAVLGAVAFTLRRLLWAILRRGLTAEFLRLWA